jgi:hypothetical protein
VYRIPIRGTGPDRLDGSWIDQVPGNVDNGLDPGPRRSRSRLEEWEVEDMYLHDPGEENGLCLLSCIICQFALLLTVFVG